MTDLDLINNRKSLVIQYLTILKKYEKSKEEDLLKNDELRGAVERYLYLVIQSTIDLAETIISQKNFRKPQTLSDSFEILEENNLIDKELAIELVKMVGFRNLLSHGYHKINYSYVIKALDVGIKDIKKFIEIITI